MSHHTNTVRIKAVANALDNLNEKVVFVGGATIIRPNFKPLVKESIVNTSVFIIQFSTAIFTQNTLN